MLWHVSRYLSNFTQSCFLPKKNSLMEKFNALMKRLETQSKQNKKKYEKKLSKKYIKNIRYTLIPNITRVFQNEFCYKNEMLLLILQALISFLLSSY